jgi:cell division protein FtsB
MARSESTFDALKSRYFDASTSVREWGAIRFDAQPMPKRAWRGLLFGAIVLLAMAQFAYWFGAGGHRQALALKQSVAAQIAENSRLEARNAELAAEVVDLRDGNDAIEERARGELGMIRPSETFYQVIDLDQGTEPPQ